MLDSRVAMSGEGGKGNWEGLVGRKTENGRKEKGEEEDR